MRWGQRVLCLGVAVLLGTFSLQGVVLGHEIEIKRLSCYETEDFVDGDEAALYIYVDDTLVNMYTSDMDDGDILEINERYTFSDEIRLELYDLDIPDIGDSNDKLGTVGIRADTTVISGIFDKDGANYKVTWKLNAAPTGPSTQPGSDPPPDITPNNKPGPTAQQSDQMKNALEKFLSKHLAKGNEGKASITKFEYSNGAIHFKVDIKHRHKPGGILGGQPLYSFNTDFEGVYDPRDPESIKKTRVCTRLNAYLGGQNVCITLEQIAAALAL